MWKYPHNNGIYFEEYNFPSNIFHVTLSNELCSKNSHHVGSPGANRLTLPILRLLSSKTY